MAIATMIAIAISFAVFALYMVMVFWKLDRKKYPKTYAWQIRMSIAVFTLMLLTIIFSRLC